MSVIYRNSTAYGRTMAYGGFTPVGTIISLMGVSAPTNYLKCDGTVYNITDYPDLANYFTAQFGQANKFGGDGTTTFAVPDLRGEFLRGTGANSHTNQGNGANVGNHQDGTEIPYFGFNQDAGDLWTQTIAGKNLGVSLGVIKEDHLNTTTVNTGEYWRRTNTFSDANGATTFTAKPTNTSVLYCIAYKDIYLADTPDITAIRRAWYVDSDNGSDSNNGKTPATAFRTIQRAVDACAPIPGKSNGIFTDPDNVGGDNIRINCAATTPYTFCHVMGKELAIQAWDFTNNVDVSSTATLNLSTSSVQAIIMARWGGTIYLAIKNINVTNTGSGAGIRSYNNSGIWFIDNSCVVNITTQGIGIECRYNSEIEFQGAVSNNASVTVTSTNSSAIISSMNSELRLNCGLSATTSGGNSSTIFSDNGRIVLANNGSTTSNPGHLYVRNGGMGGGIQFNGGFMHTVGNFTLDVQNSSSATTSPIHITRNGGLSLTSIVKTFRIVNSGTTNATGAVRAYDNSHIELNSAGTMTTNVITGGSATNGAILSGGGCRIHLASSGVTITGGTGLRAEGGDITYSSITNNASTKTFTSNGGRIYSGTQSSIPNY